MVNRREWIRLTSLSSLALLTQAMAMGASIEPDVDLVLTAAPADVSLLPGAPTQVWRFTGTLLKGPANTLQVLPGSYLGPIIRLRTGQRVRIRFVNRIGEPSIVHWHGLDVPELADGHPRFAIPDGMDHVDEFTVTNRAGTYWYHPHPHMRTAPQVYRGLAGLIIVEDAVEESLGLPSGEQALTCVLQDRRFDARNQLVYTSGGMMAGMNGFLGDRMIINGQPEMIREVDTGWLRVRLLNGSNARIYKLAWSRGLPMVLIGADGGLLERPQTQAALTLAPGQRADVLLDLGATEAGTEVHLESRAYTEADAGRTMMMGAASTVPNGAPIRLMTLRTRRHAAPPFRLPERLSTFDASWALQNDAPVRRVPIAFAGMQWTIGGRTFDMSDVAADETVTAGSTRIWEFVNAPGGMGMQAAHPMHLHGRQFRVLSRTGAAANTLRDGLADAGWLDTVLVLPGETVRVQIPFSRHAGLFMYHCHILEHEDMGMMRNLRIV
jgi:FtsP/CotA-like multicopper oxidase with cupredoxin domain